MRMKAKNNMQRRVMPALYKGIMRRIKCLLLLFVEKQKGI